MIQNLKDICKGASVAVLGSAPSVKLFERQEDVVIGVNGAGFLLKENDFFISGDAAAYSKEWFKSLSLGVTRILRAHAAIYSEFFYPDFNIRNSLIKEYENYIKNNPSDVVDVLGIKYIKDFNDFLIQFCERLSEPARPHIILRNVSINEPVSRNQKRINVGGTSACMALQVAHIMGAEEVHLYGVEFSNHVESNALYTGNNYFYSPKPNETGMTLPSQKDFMDDIIEKVMEQNTFVFSHGPTHLKNSIEDKIMAC